MAISEKLTSLRNQLLEHQLDAYIIPTTDPHRSEYPAPRWAAREWLSGFTGSAGTLVVTDREARLWTDSRYYLQAETELEGTGIELMRQHQTGVPDYPEWLARQLDTGQTVGLDGQVFSVRMVERLQEKLQSGRVALRTDLDLIDLIWTERPDLPSRPVIEHVPVFAGEDWINRLERLRAWMEERELDYYLISALDELAWLLNLRGSDINYNPLMIGYLVAGRNGDHALFARQSQDLQPWLDRLPELRLHPYEEAEAHLRRLNAHDDDLGLDPETASHHLAAAAGGDRVTHLTSPIPAWKASKSEVALNHLRELMRHDAVALLRLRRWLDTVINQGVTEYEVEQKLSELRGTYEHYVSDSFNAIVGYGGNGAIVHYRARPKTAATLRPEGLLLLDSGGQYRNGTTDITRTFALGEPTEEQRRNFTLVLAGHIDLAMARFPKGTAGIQLDILARSPLWQHELNYGHGTGHGVGFFLNVHEGPAGINANAKAKSAQYPLAPGMVLSNEPGYYKTDEYGIRIENLVAVVPGETEGWLCFETLSLFPIDYRLIEADLLTQAQRQWLSAYHQLVYDRVAPLLDQEEENWLREECYLLG